jgi:hypothetical protein
MAGKVVLEVTAGPIRGQSFTFEEHDHFIFGRAEDCHARLPETDTSASRRHFLLEVSPPLARLRDLGSRNGTFVNGVKCGGRAAGESAVQAAGGEFPQVDLNDGDEIRVGEHVLRVRVEAPPPVVERRVTMHLPTCSRCGKDVLDEAGANAAADYICQACRGVVGAQPLPPDDDAHLAGYTLERELGRGGMGAVYLARRPGDGAQVALKVMLPKAAMNERARKLFLREVEVTCDLQHPNIVEVFDHGVSGDRFYFAMQLCAGGSVMSLMERSGGRLAAPLAVGLVVEALNGLQFAHDRGFIHRDLKPENLLLTTPTSGVKIADFGLAKSFEKAGLSSMTTTQIGGTPAYAAREQIVNYRFVKPPTDVWSMGATLYTMLTGWTTRDFPVGKDPIVVILNDPVVPIQRRDPRIPKRLCELIDRALAEDPGARPTAGELARALEKAI